MPGLMYPGIFKNAGKPRPKIKTMSGIVQNRSCNYRNYFVVIIFLVLTLNTLIAQNSPDEVQKDGSKDLFNSRLMQLDFMIQQDLLVDSLVILLRKEAELFATQGDFASALSLLDQALDLTKSFDNNSMNVFEQTTTVSSQSPEIETTGIPPGKWAIEIGTDYSRLEYELSFIESDSVVLDQLNNPYLATRLLQYGYFLNRNYRLYGYLRADKGIFQSSLSMSVESSPANDSWRIEGQTDLYLQTSGSSGNFLDNQLWALWKKSISSGNQLIFNSRLRLKNHFKSDSTFGDIYYGETSLSLRHNYDLLSWLEFTLRPSLYLENQELGLRYGQIQGVVDFYCREDFNRYFQLQLLYQFRDFVSKQSGSDLSNKYHSVRPTLEVEIPIRYPFSLQSGVNSEYRKYRHPDLTYSDLLYGAISSQIKFYFTDFNSVGIGYIFEIEKHYTTSDMDKALISQENFHVNGLIVSVDIMNSSGLMISLVYQYAIKTYPNAGNQDFLGIYSNRRIHSIQGFGYIPLSHHWQFQFFANYDNDRDRDWESNDNFSTLLNVSIVYNF